MFSCAWYLTENVPIFLLRFWRPYVRKFDVLRRWDSLCTCIAVESFFDRESSHKISIDQRLTMSIISFVHQKSNKNILKTPESFNANLYIWVGSTPLYKLNKCTDCFGQQGCKMAWSNTHQLSLLKRPCILSVTRQSTTKIKSPSVYRSFTQWLLLFNASYKTDASFHRFSAVWMLPSVKSIV